jgi:hypothetical protein
MNRTIGRWNIIDAEALTSRIPWAARIGAAYVTTTERAILAAIGAITPTLHGAYC